MAQTNVPYVLKFNYIFAVVIGLHAKLFNFHFSYHSNTCVVKTAFVDLLCFS